MVAKGGRAYLIAKLVGVGYDENKITGVEELEK